MFGSSAPPAPKPVFAKPRALDPSAPARATSTNSGSMTSNFGSSVPSGSLVNSMSSNQGQGLVKRSLLGK
jgi:hypothetical protein